MDVSKKKILVVGLGKSGLSAARCLVDRGARITISDIAQEGELDPSLLEQARSLGVTLEIGTHSVKNFLQADMIVLSPGVPPGIDPLETARGKGIPILGEMGLAVQMIKIPIIAVTGTNGKSTVTAHLGDMLRRSGRSVFVGGNIGTPLMDLVEEGGEAEVVVLEVSSYQLDTMPSFSPHVSILLNISPDHLDRYSDYEAYVQSKFRIFREQGRGDFAVFNDDDDRLASLEPSGGMSVLRYGVEERKNRQAFLRKDGLVVRMQGEKSREFDLGHFKLRGRHNRENLMGIVLGALALGVEAGSIQASIDGFEGLHDRLERVGRVGGVEFYNDSKATNVSAAVRSMESFESPIVLIAGGRDKGGDYGPFAEVAKARVREVVLIGESKGLISAALEKSVPYRFAEDMGDAVSAAFSAAASEDIVLLAPACSSFDMFTDYAHRGRAFKEAVRRLEVSEATESKRSDRQ